MIKKTSEKIPQKTMETIKEVLAPEEYELFEKSFDQDVASGLRINTLKISVEEFLKITPFSLEPIPWTKNGFYYKKEERPGRHPYYYAGLYYIQEPSAMLPAEFLSPKEDSVVLDLCAAPGGKSTQLGEMMKNKGCLFVNDISPKRTMALIGNIIRMGLTNVVVCNSKPETFKKELQGFFSHVLVDAPCSGEGMFRRDPASIDQLSLYSIDECQISQREILDSAIKTLRDDGLLAYSTCTFNKKENEENLSWLENNFQIEILKSKRIWPHKERGEGQFASLVKNNEEINYSPELFKSKKFYDESFQEFINQTITEKYRAIFDFKKIIDIKGKIYLLPENYPLMKKINVIRPGWFLGEIKKNRFEPSPDIPLALPIEAFIKKVNFSSKDREVTSYLKGETLIKDFPEKGWGVIAVDGFPLGWFKKDGNILKNYYPKNMRRMD